MQNSNQIKDYMIDDRIDLEKIVNEYTTISLADRKSSDKSNYM